MRSSMAHIREDRPVLAIAASAVLAFGLATGAAVIAPDSAQAAAKVGKTSIAATGGQGYIKVTAKKVKGAGFYQYRVYKGAKANGKPVEDWVTKRRKGVRFYLRDGQTYCVKARAVSGKWYVKGKKTRGAWSKPKTVESSYILHKITYDTASGDAPDQAWPTRFTRATETFDLPIPVREGYTFDHWHCEYEVKADGETYHRSCSPVKVEKGTEYDLKLKAIWTRNWTPGGGSGGGTGSVPGNTVYETVYASDDVKAAGEWLATQGDVEYRPDTATTTSVRKVTTTVRGYYVKDGQRWLGPVTKIAFAGGVPFIAGSWPEHLELSGSSKGAGTLALTPIPGAGVDAKDLSVRITGSRAVPVNLAATRGGDGSGLKKAWWVGSETSCLAELTATASDSDNCLSVAMSAANVSGSFTVTALYKGSEVASCKVTSAGPSPALAEDLSRVRELESQCWTDGMDDAAKLAMFAAQIGSSYSYRECDCIDGARLLMLAARYDLGIEGCYYERCSAYMSSCSYDGVASYFNDVPGASHVYLVVPIGSDELLLHAQGGDSLSQKRVSGSWGGTSGNWERISTQPLVIRR